MRLARFSRDGASAVSWAEPAQIRPQNPPFVQLPATAIDAPWLPSGH